MELSALGVGSLATRLRTPNTKKATAKPSPKDVAVGKQDVAVGNITLLSGRILQDLLLGQCLFLGRRKEVALLGVGALCAELNFVLAGFPGVSTLSAVNALERTAVSGTLCLLPGQNPVPGQRSAAFERCSGTLHDHVELQVPTPSSELGAQDPLHLL